MRKSKSFIHPKGQSLLLLVGVVGSMLLVACGNADNTSLSSASTALASGAQTAGTFGVVSLTQAPTVIAGAVQTSGTALAGSAQTAGTVLAGAAQTAGTYGAVSLTKAPTMIAGAVQTSGTALAGGANQAGSAVAEFLTPGNTLTAPATTPSPVASLTVAAGLPVYPRAAAVTLENTERGQLVYGLDAFASVVDQPTFNFYKVSGLTSRDTVTYFYKTELVNQGWLDRTEVLATQLKQKNLSFLGNDLAVYTKGTELVLVGVSAPLTGSTLSNLKLSDKFSAGDVAIMTALGQSKVKIS